MAHLALRQNPSLHTAVGSGGTGAGASAGWASGMLRFVGADLVQLQHGAIALLMIGCLPPPPPLSQPRTHAACARVGPHMRRCCGAPSLMSCPTGLSAAPCLCVACGALRRRGGGGGAPRVTRARRRSGGAGPGRWRCSTLVRCAPPRARTAARVACTPPLFSPCPSSPRHNAWARPPSCSAPRTAAAPPAARGGGGNASSCRRRRRGGPGAPGVAGARSAVGGCTSSGS